MLADLESLIPPACLAVGFVLLVRTILKHQNPQRRAAARAREAAAEASDPRIMQDQALPADLRAAAPRGRTATGTKTSKTSKTSKTEA